MIWPIYAVYVLTVAFIRVYKWIELQVLKLFAPIVKKRCLKTAASVGLVFQCETDKERTPADNEVALLMCSEKYNKLIHFNVHNNSAFVRFANLGALGFGECFIDGSITCTSGWDDVTELSTRWLENNMFDKHYYNWWNKTLEWLELFAFNLQTRKRAFQVTDAHYDLGNDLFQVMLGKWMQYTCAYWKDADNLDDAQVDKMELIAKKLDLKPGMRVLDIGCGWGTLCKYLAENYKVECVGVSIGKEGVKYAKEICKGLSVDIRLQDYRDVNEQFDRVVCVEMLEHVGRHNYSEYFNVVNRCMKDDGIFLLHVIGRNHAKYPPACDPWIQRYLFPNMYIPDPELITKATKGLFIIEDWHNFGQDFAKTLFAWRENCMKGLPQLEDKKKYDERFCRMWMFFLSSSIGLLRSRRLQLWQIVFSKDGLKSEYRAAR